MLLSGWGVRHVWYNACQEMKVGSRVITVLLLLSL